MSYLLKEVLRHEGEIIAIRRRIHEHPELSYHETETAKLVAQKLKSLGLDVRENVGGTGVVGLLKGKGSGKVVALRADMDALPLEEKADVVFRSKAKGIMHACGHDTHVAMLLGAARLLVDHKDGLTGSVKFLFQPAEEAGGIGGAKPMIDDGALKSPKVDYAFGLHIWGGLGTRIFGLRSGPLMASSDFFKIRVIGKGGHGSAPHQTIDPIFVASQLIVALQGISSRIVDPVEPLVVSVCSVHSGTKNNIIPDDAVLEGTIRTLDSKTRARAIRYTREIATSICRTFGASCEISFMENTNPVTYNDPRVTTSVFRILGRLKGTRAVEMKPVLAGEDFSRFLEIVPGAFYFLGTKNPKKGCVYPNHSSQFKVDEDVLKYGAASLASLAMEFTNPS